ncbi:MAG: hypothetical protein IVW57_16505 [Ktedonobacterales bacterium]|nr:hypothetical protein [Ktedonobacterales bacterium]
MDINQQGFDHISDSALKHVVTPRFGGSLKYYRESYFARSTGRPQGAPGPRMYLSALALIECLKDNGYSLSSGAYSGIETGDSIPKDVPGFLEAVARCLALNEQEVLYLRQDLAFDLVESRVGRRAAKMVVQREATVGRELRTWRSYHGLTEPRLAACLMEHGFRESASMRAEELAQRLSAIEREEEWPFTEKLRASFVEACAECLGATAADDIAAALGRAR